MRYRKILPLSLAFVAGRRGCAFDASRLGWRPHRHLVAVLFIGLFAAPFNRQTAQAQRSALQTGISPASGGTANPNGGATSTEAQADELRDIKALRPPRPVRWPWYVAAAAAAIALCAALWFGWRRARRRRKNNLLPQLPPHDIALKALAALHQINFADRAAVRHYYFSISEVLRTYMEARFKLTATQLTTEEIFTRLPELVELPPPESLRFRTFLAQTDQVKYAQHQPTPEEIGAVYTLASEFIHATAQPSQPPVQTPGTA